MIIFGSGNGVYPNYGNLNGTNHHPTADLEGYNPQNQHKSCRFYGTSSIESHSLWLLRGQSYHKDHKSGDTYKNGR